MIVPFAASDDQQTLRDEEMSKIYKHTIKVVILSETPELNGDWDLETVSELITNGSDIGTYGLESTEEVPRSKVKAELIAIGNDGTFFDSDYTKTAFLHVSKETADLMNRLLNETDSKLIKDSVQFDHEVVFDDGFRMAIQVVSSSVAGLSPRLHPCWTQGVLFDEAGNELNFTEVGESFLGEYTCDYDGITYEAIVEIAQES